MLFDFTAPATVPTVTTEVIRTRDLDAIVSASGKIQPKRQVNISATTMGRVTRLAVQEGQRVKAGQFLLEIDPRSFAGALEGEHSVDVHDHRCGGAADVFFGIVLPELSGFLGGEALRDVAIQRIVSGGLVGDYIDLHSAADNFRQHVTAVANEADGECAAFAAGGFAELESFVEIFGDGVAVAVFNASFDAVTVYFDN